MSDTPWGPIGKEVYDRTYSRTKPDGTKETWEDTVKRVVDGNISLVKPQYIEKGEADALYAFIKDFKIMPAGRHLWMSGVEGRQYLFNCHRAGWTRNLSEHFAFMFYELMKGGGVGANYTVKGFDYKVNPIHLRLFYDKPMLPQDRDTNSEYIEVEDSKEGWRDALISLLDMHQKRASWSSLSVYLGGIRPKGAPINSFGGVSAGPECLGEMLKKVNHFLNDLHSRYTVSGDPYILSSMDLMALDHFIAEAVVAGNVRRSARMSIMNWNDPEIMDFINCKQDPELHWSTNISVELDRDFFVKQSDELSEYKQVILRKIAEGMATNGEPGIFNSLLASQGERGDISSTNPCGEIALEEWENCNLGHINLANIEDDAEALQAVYLMSRFLYRATFSPDASPKQRDILHKNRRIGVGVYGFQEWLANRWELKLSDLLNNEDKQYIVNIGGYLQYLRDFIKQSTDKYAENMGTPAPIKHTTVAPTGTISMLSGHTAGIHPVVASYFVRKVRYSEDDPELEGIDPQYLEDDIYSDNTKILSYLCKDPILDRVHDDLVQTASELSVEEQLFSQMFMQTNWANNAVSYTVKLPDNMPSEDLYQVLLGYVPYLKGITAYPTKSRPQQPITEITKEQYEQYNKGNGYLLSTDSALTEECEGGACPVK